MKTLKQQILLALLVLALVQMKEVRANNLEEELEEEDERSVIRIEENVQFNLTYGLDTKNISEHKYQILKFNVTQDGDYLQLSAYNVIDYTHNPTIFISDRLQMLTTLIHHFHSTSIPSHVIYTTCSLEFTSSCIISNPSIKVQAGQLFYLVLIGAGQNNAFAKISTQDYQHSQTDIPQALDANVASKMYLINASSQNRITFTLSEQLIQQANTPLIAQLEVVFMHPSGVLLGDQNRPWEQNHSFIHDQNKVALLESSNQVSNDKLIFTSKLQNNRYFAIQFQLGQFVQQKNIQLEIQHNYNYDEIIGIGVKYSLFPLHQRTVNLTAPVITSLFKKSNNLKQNEVLLYFSHPFFEFLASKDKLNEKYKNFQPPKDYKYTICFDIIDVTSTDNNNNNNIQNKLEYQIYHNNNQFKLGIADEIFSEQSRFKVDINKITRVAEQDITYKGILLQIISDSNLEQNNVYIVQSYLLLEQDTSTENNNNNNENNNNTNSKDNKNDDKQDESVIIMIVIVGIVGFIVVSSLVYVKCIKNKSIEDAQQLEEIGEDGDKHNDEDQQNYADDDVEKGNNSSGNNRIKPQSTKNSIKTNGDHIELAQQDDDKSGLQHFSNHQSSVRKSNNSGHQDLSSNNLKSDKNSLIGKNPPSRKKNRKSHLRIEVEDSSYDNAKEQSQQQFKQQQLKLMQQQALKQQLKQIQQPI